MNNHSNSAKTSFEKGIIYSLFELFFALLKTLNAVEWFKACALYFSTSKNETLFRRAAVDLFILLKFVILGLAFNYPNAFFVSIVCYLTIFNIFTYFYYHIWCPPEEVDLESLRRRFINLFLSIMFNVVAFAFFYKASGIQLKIGGYGAYLVLSIMNTFMLGADILEQDKSSMLTYKIIFICQAMTSFSFLTLILSNTEIKNE